MGPEIHQSQRAVAASARIEHKPSFAPSRLDAKWKHDGVLLVRFVVIHCVISYRIKIAVDTYV